MKAQIFNTKEDIRKILYAFANMKILKNSVEYTVLYELLSNHPEADQKIGCGIDYFFVQPSKWKMNQYNFMIQRIDGSSVDFSYLKCLKPGIPSSTDNNWSHIFRDIIKDQVASFRNSAYQTIGIKDKFICSHTNLKFKKIYSHVDHVYPVTFQSIMLEFIKINKIDVNKLELSPDLGTSEIQKILDQDIVKNFYKFHKDRAVLRLVCNTANFQGKRTKNYNNGDPVELKKELIKKYPQYHIK